MPIERLPLVACPGASSTGTELCAHTLCRPLPLPPAPAAAIGHECDLALLSVEDRRFWEEPSPMKPLQLGEVPQLQVGRQGRAGAGQLGIG